MLTKAMLKDLLQDLIDLTNEINWKDETLPDIFEEDLKTNVGNLAKTLYAMSGYQSWNGIV